MNRYPTYLPPPDSYQPALIDDQPAPILLTNRSLGILQSEIRIPEGDAAPEYAPHEVVDACLQGIDHYPQKIKELLSIKPYARAVYKRLCSGEIPVGRSGQWITLRTLFREVHPDSIRPQMENRQILQKAIWDNDVQAIKTLGTHLDWFPPQPDEIKAMFMLPHHMPSRDEGTLDAYVQLIIARKADLNSLEYPALLQEALKDLIHIANTDVTTKIINELKKYSYQAGFQQILRDSLHLAITECSPDLIVKLLCDSILESLESRRIGALSPWSFFGLGNGYRSCQVSDFTKSDAIRQTFLQAIQYIASKGVNTTEVYYEAVHQAAGEGRVDIAWQMLQLAADKESGIHPVELTRTLVCSMTTGLQCKPNNTAMSLPAFFNACEAFMEKEVIALIIGGYMERSRVGISKALQNGNINIIKQWFELAEMAKQKDLAIEILHTAIFDNISNSDGGFGIGLQQDARCIAEDNAYLSMIKAYSEFPISGNFVKKLFDGSWQKPLIEKMMHRKGPVHDELVKLLNHLAQQPGFVDDFKKWLSVSYAKPKDIHHFLCDSFEFLSEDLKNAVREVAQNITNAESLAELIGFRSEGAGFIPQFFEKFNVRPDVSTVERFLALSLQKAFKSHNAQSISLIAKMLELMPKPSPDILRKLLLAETSDKQAGLAKAVADLLIHKSELIAAYGELLIASGLHAEELGEVLDMFKNAMAPALLEALTSGQYDESKPIFQTARKFGLQLDEASFERFLQGVLANAFKPTSRYDELKDRADIIRKNIKVLEAGLFKKSSIGVMRKILLAHDSKGNTGLSQAIASGNSGLIAAYGELLIVSGLKGDELAPVLLEVGNLKTAFQDVGQYGVKAYLNLILKIQDNPETRVSGNQAKKLLDLLRKAQQTSFFTFGVFVNSSDYNNLIKMDPGFGKLFKLAKDSLKDQK